MADYTIYPAVHRDTYEFPAQVKEAIINSSEFQTAHRINDLNDLDLSGARDGMVIAKDGNGWIARNIDNEFYDRSQIDKLFEVVNQHPFTGPYVANKHYSKSELVSHSGNTYVAKTSGVLSTPGVDSNWAIFAKKGDKGDEGPYGGTSVTDPQVASFLKTENTQTLVELKRRIDVFDVRDYGAVANGTTDDTNAIQEAIDAALVNGGVVKFPSAKTLLVSGSLRIQGQNSKKVILDGNDSLILTWGTTNTQPVLWMGNENATTETHNLRRVVVRNLRIQSHANWNSDTSQERMGVVLDVVQDIYFENVWISGYNHGCLVTYDCFDSNFVNVQLLKCDSITNHALQLRGRFDQSNANHFFGLHIEGSQLGIGIYDGSRHNQFTASKYEVGSFANTGTVSPIHIEGLENVFLGFQGVKNLLDEVPFIYGPYEDYISNAPALNLPARVTRFVGCLFATPLGGATRWVKGSFLKFDSCTFYKGAGQSDYQAFELHFDSHLIGCDLQMRPGHSGVVRFTNQNSSVINTTVRLSTNTNTGPQIYLPTTASNNVVDNFKILGGGSPQYRVLSDLVPEGWGSNYIRLHPGYSESKASTTSVLDARTDEVVVINDASQAIYRFAPRYDGSTFTLINATSSNLSLMNTHNIRAANYPEITIIPGGKAASFAYYQGYWYQN